MVDRKLTTRLAQLITVCIAAPAVAFGQTKPFSDETPPPKQTEEARPDDERGQRTQTLIRGWPFFYKSRGPGDRVTTDALFPFYHYERVGSLHSGRLAPFYFHGRDETSQQRWSLFLPLYYSSRKGDDWQWRSLPLSFGYGAENNETWWQFPTTLSLYRGSASTEGRTDRFGIWPLVDIFARQSHPGGQAIDVLGFLSWRDPGEAWLPFLRYRSSYGETREAGVFPLWHYRVRDRGQARNTRWWIPLLGLWKWNSNTASEAGWLPLAFRYQGHPESRSWSALFGAWGGGYDAGNRWSRLEPFYSTKSGEGHSATTILRLFGTERSKERGHRAVKILPPLGYFASDNYGYSQRFLPFYFAGGSNRADVPSSSYFAILPFYYQYRSPRQERRLIFPLYYDSQKSTMGSDGVEQSYGHRIGFPLYWHEWSPQSKSLHVLPMYSHLSNSTRDLTLWGGPLYIHRREHRRGGTVDHSVLWPLFGTSYSDDHRHFRAAPLIWLTRHNDGTAFDLVAPFYLRVATPRSTHHWFLPIYGHYEHRREDETEISRDFYAGGVLTHTVEKRLDSSRGRRSWHLFGPLAGISTSDDDREQHSRFLPLWWSTRSDDHSRIVALPFFYHERSGRGEGTSSFTLAGGNLWVDVRQKDHRDFGVLYPLTRFRRSETVSSDQILFLYERTRRTPTEGAPTSRARLSPFYFASQGEESESVHQWWHLWSSQRREDVRRFRVMPFIASREQTPSGVQWDVLGGLIRHRDHPQKEQLTWIAPIYLEHRIGPTSDPDRTLFTIFPFYYRSWQRATRETTTAILFPFFTHAASRDGSSRRLSLLWPLAEIRRSEGYRSARVFPLFATQSWDTGERSWDLSLLYRSKMAASGTEVGGLSTRDGYLGLQLARRAQGTSTSTFAINPLLFGYHHDERIDLVHWQSLFMINRYWRQGVQRSYSALGLIHGGSSADRSWHSTFPLYFSDSYSQTEMPSFNLPSTFHLFSRSEDANTSKWSLLGYLANGRRRKNSSDSEFRILYRGAAFIRRGSYRERVIQPFFNYESDENTGQGYFSLGKLLYIQRRDSRMDEWKRYVLGIPLQW